ncbi:MAG: LysR substrate-binding domain-containing protein [Myxococcaceae bacterium]
MTTANLNHVSVFVRVVETGSFTSAASALGLPKSSVSRSVARLEGELGVRLLQRTTRSVHLTDAGHAYYERVARALSGLEEAQAAVSDMQAKPRGTVRVTAAVDVGVNVVAGLVARFLREHPDIHVEMVLTGRLVNLVDEGVDLAVRAGKLDDSSLVARRVGTVEGRLLASPGYLRRRGTPKAVAELARQDCVLFRARRGQSTWELTGPKGVERVDVSGRVSADDYAFVRQMLLAGGGIGLVPWTTCAQDLERGRLVRVLEDYAAPGGALHVVYPSSRYVPQRVALLRDFLVKGLLERATSCDAKDAGRKAAARAVTG